MNGNGTEVFLSHLPGVYHSSAELRELLAIFETVFFGPDGDALTTKIALIASYFDAAETPEEFLPWLGQWAALSYTQGLSLPQQRLLLSEIVPLYAKRGTKTYLERLLQFFSPAGADIRIEDQDLPGLIVGQAKVGVDAWLEPERAFCFTVRIRAPKPPDGAEREAHLRSDWQERARRVIELAKPAHTAYELDWAFGE